MTIALEDRYDDRIVGVLSCYDRVVKVLVQFK
jgi:hypothetical protein